MANKLERRSSHVAAVILFLSAPLAPVGVAAQQAIVPLEFSFSDPGARSLGFAGAFVALADDATAAFANPAGLTQLIRPEISIEGRRWSYSTPYTVGGRYEGTATGFGIDNTDGLRTANSGKDQTNLSFMSFAFPGDDWSLAFYRHQLADYAFFAETQGLFGGTGLDDVNREPDQRVSADVDFVSYGLSGAYRLHDRFDVGLGLVYYDASIDTDATSYLWDEDTVESVFSPNSYLFERSVLTQRSNVDETDWAWTGGFLWRPLPDWSIGGVYRQGPEIENEIVLIAGQAIDFGVPPGEEIARLSGVDIEFPDNYGLGFAYRHPDGHLTLSFQWNHVEYTSIVESLELDDQTVDDVDELHFGGEYVFFTTTPVIAMRLGAWWEPDNQIRANSNAEPVVRALLPRGDDEWHYAAGLGLAMENFQVDFAADFADRVDTIALSVIYSF